jgi:hypothetical protein
LAALTVSTSPAAVMQRRNVNSGHAAQMPLDATAFPKDLACVIELCVTPRQRTSVEKGVGRAGLSAR